MSSIAVMQPYFFPYIGYFQLIKSVNKFVFYDDVDFIKNGWINRNRIVINENPKYITVPCKNISSHEKIENIKHGLDQRKRKKLLKKIKFTYSRAPFFEKVFTIVKQVLEKETEYISDLAIDSVKKSAAYLDLECSFLKSSEKYENKDFDAADRLIDICNIEGIDNYVNPIGGQKLYNKEFFKEKEISLYFLKSEEIKYKQFGDKFVSWLSIIDIMMFNSPEKIKNDLLTSYELV